MIVKFYKGLASKATNYLSNGEIYFATDEKVIYMGGNKYGVAASDYEDLETALAQCLTGLGTITTNESSIVINFTKSGGSPATLTLNAATASKAGLMSAEDKENLDTLVEALGDIEDIGEAIDEAIGELNYTGKTSGAVVTNVTEASGVISVTAADITSTDKTVKVNGLDLGVNIDGTTIVKGTDGKLSVAPAATAVNGEDAIEVEDSTSGKTVKLNIASTDKVLSQSEDGLATTLKLNFVKASENTADGANKGKPVVQLVGKSNAVITEIDASDFVADGFLDKVEWKSEGSNVLVFTWNTTAGKTATEIDLTRYIDTYLAGNGLNLDSATKTFSVKVKDGDKYLTVDTNGVASKGIDEAIASAVEDATEDAIEAVTVNSVEATVTNKTATVEIDGSNIKIAKTGTALLNTNGILAQNSTVAAAITALEDQLIWHEA